MTPLDLQDELAKVIEELFSGYDYRLPGGGRSKLNIFTQHIPINQTDDEEEPVPYIIVRLSSGDDDGTRDSYNTVRVLIIAGIFDDSLEAQGHRDISNIFQMIYQRFHENPSLSKARYSGEFHWALQEDNYYPYYFGACSMEFYIAAIRREDEFA